MLVKPVLLAACLCLALAACQSRGGPPNPFASNYPSAAPPGETARGPRATPPRRTERAPLPPAEVPAIP